MSPQYLTYVELAEVLGLSSKTVRNHWRHYPHIFVTPASLKSGNLKGARFDIDVVMKYLENESGNCNGYQKNRKEERHCLSGLLQVQRKTVSKGVLHKKRSQRVGNECKEELLSGNNYASEFDVFTR